MQSANTKIKPQHLQISARPGGMEICHLHSHLFNSPMHETYIHVHTSLYSCCEATLPVDPSKGPASYLSTTVKHVSSLTQV